MNVKASQKRLRINDRTRCPESIDPVQENVDNLKEETDTRRELTTKADEENIIGLRREDL